MNGGIRFEDALYSLGTRFILPAAVIALLGVLAVALLNSIGLSEWVWAVKSTVAGAVGGFAVAYTQLLADA